jgi:hypothetical protein
VGSRSQAWAEGKSRVKTEEISDTFGQFRVTSSKYGTVVYALGKEGVHEFYPDLRWPMKKEHTFDEVDPQEDFIRNAREAIRRITESRHIVVTEGDLPAKEAEEEKAEESPVADIGENEERFLPSSPLSGSIPPDVLREIERMDRSEADRRMGYLPRRRGMGRPRAEMRWWD